MRAAHSGNDERFAYSHPTVTFRGANPLRTDESQGLVDVIRAVSKTLTYAIAVPILSNAFAVLNTLLPDTIVG